MLTLSNSILLFNIFLIHILTITYYFRSEIAKYIKPDSYGLILGFNFFMSLLLISIFTLFFIQGLVVVIGTKNQVKWHNFIFHLIIKTISQSSKLIYQHMGLLKYFIVLSSGKKNFQWKECIKSLPENKFLIQFWLLVYRMNNNLFYLFLDPISLSYICCDVCFVFNHGY